MQNCLPLTLPRISSGKIGGMGFLHLLLHSFLPKIVGRWRQHIMPVSFLKAWSYRVLIF